MSNYPISTIVEVNVTKQEGIASLEDFGAVCVFTEDTTIPAGTVWEFVSQEGFASAFPTATSSIRIWGDTFFMQSPTPTKLFICGVDPVGSTYPETIVSALESFNFYGISIDNLNLSETVLTSIAAQVETSKLLFIQDREDSDVATLATQWQALNYTRSALVNKDNGTVDTNRVSAAMFGSCITFENPGAINWANVTLTGVTASENAQSVIDAQLLAGVNVYVNYGDFSITRDGRTTGNTETYIDQIVTMDYLRINIEQDVATLVLNSDKIPYTDAGMKTVEGVVLNRLNQAAQLGMLDPSVRPTATAPSVTTVSDTQKASRIAPTITATGRLSGAVNKFIIDVNVEI